MDTDITDMKLMGKNMGISDKEQPYIFVLDKNGKSREVQSGKFSEDKMDRIEEACGGDWSDPDTKHCNIISLLITAPPRFKLIKNGGLCLTKIAFLVFKNAFFKPSA